ncbi:MAG TPA: DUF2238 domain-containing protein [Candidatus Nanoarchaeia archaeon]|nr:DUF2238 domain-containing protein [Candidatus Nanoarchaeia archaeon]
MIKLKKGEWFLILFNLAYVIAFAVYYISIKNYEFLWYVLVLVFFFLVIGLTLRKTNFNYLILWGLSLWGLLHMSGGGLIIRGDVLYGLELIHLFDIGDTYVLKFDQFVHAFGFSVTTLVAWHLLKPYLNQKTNYKVIYVLLVAIAMGAGVLNEIVEFIAVVVAPETGVGGYYNTALDLVFNTIGSVIAVIFIHFKYRKNKNGK